MTSGVAMSEAKSSPDSQASGVAMSEAKSSPKERASEPLGFVTVDDGQGGTVMRPVPASQIPQKRKRSAAAVQREIIRANPDSAAQELRGFVERLERLHDEKQAIADDIKTVLGEAKGSGFDSKAINTILRIRAQDRLDRQESEAILETYKTALGIE
ncbi:MAG: DUF2312 domain-containing protein [Pacificimonas sp.]|jgi:uncharacterized protein (UPF0335 family)|nr:DUF2312 domain-containing protein [Pacificimonas sp.]